LSLGRANPGGVEEIVVTARRREESLQDVPIAVTAFSATSSRSSAPRTSPALQQTTPNLTLQVARGSNSTLIAFIRGVGQQDPLWGFEPGVGLYIDDVYVARPQGAVLDIYDIQRIEVLRGPQGTLYGRNTVGGAIKYVTTRIGQDERSSMPRQPRLVPAARHHPERRHAGHDYVVHRWRGWATCIGATASARTSSPAPSITTRTSRHSAARLEWTPSENLFVRLSGDILNDDSNPRHGHRESAGLNGTRPAGRRRCCRRL
jgi:iron complex outermembrane receptor protein